MDFLQSKPCIDVLLLYAFWRTRTWVPAPLSVRYCLLSKIHFRSLNFSPNVNSVNKLLKYVNPVLKRCLGLSYIQTGRGWHMDECLRTGLTHLCLWTGLTQDDKFKDQKFILLLFISIHNYICIDNAQQCQDIQHHSIAITIGMT